MRSASSGMVSISSLAAAMAGAYWPRNIAPVGGEVVVVHPVSRIEIHRPGAVVELTVCDDRLLIPVHRVAVVTALHVYVGGHMHQVAHIGGELTQTVSGNQCDFRMRRHFHQMDVEVQKAGMVHRLRQIAE